MKNQPEALRLADELDEYWDSGEAYGLVRYAADELRRLSALNGELLEALNSIASTRASHLAALDPQRAKRIARAAIAKATGEITS